MVKFARTLSTTEPSSETLSGSLSPLVVLALRSLYGYQVLLPRASHPENMGTSPEPNLTVLWSTKLPEGLGCYCAKSLLPPAHSVRK